MAAAKPRALRPGDRLALLAPAGPSPSEARLEAAVRALSGLGFEPLVYDSCRAARGYLAGPDGLRAADLNAAFADPAIAGIVCLKGGYGSPRLLDRLDYGLIARSPKALVGYSDVTALHLALGRFCGFPSFHGPMPSSDMVPELDAFSRASWLAALCSSEALGLLPRPEGAAPPRTLVPGRARGRLVGGNLSLIASLLGTPYALEARGRILFLEDVHEAPYRIDRMLNQLRLAGVFRDCAGLVLGSFKDCEPEPGKPSLALPEILEDLLVPAGKPALLGFPAGHALPSLCLPLGVEAELDAEAGELRILEAAAR